MTIATKVAALLIVVRKQDVEELCPAERRQLADLCRHVAGLAEPKDDPPRHGVLYELKTRPRDE